MPKARTTPSIPLIDTIHEVPAGYVDQSEESRDCLLLTEITFGLVELSETFGVKRRVCVMERIVRGLTSRLTPITLLFMMKVQID